MRKDKFNEIEFIRVNGSLVLFYIFEYNGE